MTIGVLEKRGQSHSAVARLMKVTEGTVRYHLAREAAGAVDGRKKASLIERLGLAEAVGQRLPAHPASRIREFLPDIWKQLRENGTSDIQSQTNPTIG